MADAPILDECRVLLGDLDRVERQLAMLADNMPGSVANQSEDEISQIEDQIPSDVLASLDSPTEQEPALSTQFQASAERLPSDVERFLDRVISDANQSVVAESKLPEGVIGSLPVTSASRRVAAPRQAMQKSVAAPQAEIKTFRAGWFSNW